MRLVSRTSVRSNCRSVIVDDTFDYYAQDADGNVGYFGEDASNYVYDDDGDFVETNDSSSWPAGVNDALPGFIMSAVDSLNVESL